jgi:hypothetical protein
MAIMAKIMIQCPNFRKPVSTGVDTDSIVFKTLPNVPFPVKCPACGKTHRWKPKEAWVDGERKPRRNGRS